MTSCNVESESTRPVDGVMAVDRGDTAHAVATGSSSRSFNGPDSRRERLLHLDAQIHPAVSLTDRHSTPAPDLSETAPLDALGNATSSFRPAAHRPNRRGTIGSLNELTFPTADSRGRRDSNTPGARSQHRQGSWRQGSSRGSDRAATPMSSLKHESDSNLRLTKRLEEVDDIAGTCFEQCEEILEQLGAVDQTEQAMSEIRSQLEQLSRACQQSMRDLTEEELEFSRRLAKEQVAKYEAKLETARKASKVALQNQANEAEASHRRQMDQQAS